MPGMTGKRSAINKASPRFRNFGSRYRVGSLDFRGGPARYWRMQIEFTPEQREFVRRAVESGRYERPEDAVQAAMTLWVERERRRAEILAAVDIAKASIDRGDGIEITRESMRALAEDVKRRGRAQLAAEQPAAR
jgi:Arc/MetJ-type ribon-helix-helix transcriptional regulator